MRGYLVPHVAPWQKPKGTSLADRLCSLDLKDWMPAAGKHVVGRLYRGLKLERRLFKGERRTRAYAVNDGHCLKFVLSMLALMRKSYRFEWLANVRILGTTAMEDAEPSDDVLKHDGEHYWLMLYGRHYDAQTPDGVEDWRQLGFFE